MGWFWGQGLGPNPDYGILAPLNLKKVVSEKRGMHFKCHDPSAIQNEKILPTNMRFYPAGSPEVNPEYVSERREYESLLHVFAFS